MEIADKLKGINASDLINSLLHKHFSSSKLKTMTTEELKAFIEAKQLEKIAKDKLEGLNHGN
jgi:hypothetical protein